MTIQHSDASAAFVPPGARHPEPPSRGARFVLRLLERIGHGELKLVTPDGRPLRFGGGQPTATMRLPTRSASTSMRRAIALS